MNGTETRKWTAIADQWLKSAAIAAMLMHPAGGLTQGADLMAGSASSANGARFSYVTRLEPPEPPLSRTGGGILTEKNTVKRHVLDFVEGVYSGYDLTMEPLPDGRYQYTFSPLSMPPEQMGKIFKRASAWRMVPLPVAPTTHLVRSGDTIRLDLFINRSTGQKVYDVLTVGGNGAESLAAGPARDFSVDQAWLELRDAKVSVNGTAVASAGEGGVGGSPMWIYLRGRGRFIFSLQPRTDLGFQKAGEIRGRKLSWRWGGDDFVVSTSRRIAPGEGAFHLYVFHDPAYRIETDDPIMIGAGGKLESYVRR